MENIITPTNISSICTDCELYKSSSFGSYSCNKLWGEGIKNAYILFLDNTPKDEEVKQRKPFVGQEGQLLKKYCNTIGIKDVYYTYLNKCKPAYGQTISRGHKETCSKYLIEEIKEVKPKVIVALGGGVLEFFGLETKITKSRGIPVFLEKYNCWLIPTYNPAYLANFIEGAKQAREFVEDLAKAWQIANEGYSNEKTEVKYEFASTIFDVERMTKQLLAAEWFSADTENDAGLDYFKSKNLINSFSLEENTAFVIPYLHPKGFDEKGQKEVFKYLKKIYESDVKKIFQFGKYDIQVLKTNGINVKKFAFDTCLAHALLDENSPHGLDTIVPIYTDMGHYKDEVSDYFKGKIQIPNEGVFQIGKDCFRWIDEMEVEERQKAQEYFKKKLTVTYKLIEGKIRKKLYVAEAYRKSTIYDCPYNKLVHYAAQDADATFRLFKKFWGLLEKENLLNHLVSIDVPLSFVLAHMEYEGILGDLEYAKKEANKLLIHLEEAERIVLGSKEVNQFMQKYQVPNNKFNIASSDQVANLLFDIMGLRPVKYNKLTITMKKEGKKRGTPSVDKKCLQILYENNKNLVLENLLKVGEVAKAYEYLEGYVKLLENSRDSRIHTSFNQVKMEEGGGTITGRLSSKNPNLQNIPKRDPEKAKVLRKTFISKLGYSFVAADYSQIEFRIWGEASGDENLIKFINEGIDIHTRVAAISRKIPEEQVTKGIRDIAKMTVYGMIYGRSTYSIAKEYNMNDWEVEQFVNGFFKLFPRATQFLEENVKLMKQQGYIENIFKRRRRVLEIYSKDKILYASGERKIRNFPLQGGAADLVFIAMRDLYRVYLPYSGEAKLLVQIHDELISEVKDELLSEICLLKKEVMEKAGNLGIKIAVDMKVGKNLGELIEWKF